MTKYDKLPTFDNRLIEFRSIVLRTEETKNKKRWCIKMSQIYIINC